MQWIITKDLINTEPGDVTNRANKVWNPNERFAMLYSAAPEEAKPGMKQGFIEAMTDEFRLYDDDGELYYEGKCKDLDDQDGDSAFEPLDWARADAGCTTMKYRKIGSNGKWEVL